MPVVFDDLRYAVRQWRRDPGAAAIAILTMALGIGVNAAVFSAANGFVRPLPVRAPEQLTVLAAQDRGDATGTEKLQYMLSYPALMDFRRQAGAFSDLFGYQVSIGGLVADGRGSQILYSHVTSDFFSALGIRPAAGRFILPGEGETLGAEPVMVLGYACWQRRFGGDRAVIGKRVLVEGKPATIIGVAPKGFHGLYHTLEMEAYLPLSHARELGYFGAFPTDRGERFLTVVGRMRPGVSIRQSQSEVNVIAGRLARQYPDTDKAFSVRVFPETLARPVPVFAGVVPMVGGLFLALAMVVLLLASINVANLMLVRATARERELAVRAALGSGRGRLIRQMLTESAALAAVGGLAGIVVGKWASDAIAGMRVETGLPMVFDPSFDWRVFLYALAATAVTGLAAGAWPALRASRTDAGAVLHESSRTGEGCTGRQRIRRALVAVQVAGSLTLLIVAGLFVRSLEGAQRFYLGFDPDRLLNVIIDPLYAGYDEARTKEFYRELDARVRALPGVQSASFAYSVPLGYCNWGGLVHAEDRPETPGVPPPLVLYNSVNAAYFENLRVPLLGGRAFRESDDDRTPRVAIVNQTMARQFWPGQNPIGKRFAVSFHSSAQQGPMWEVVGLAGDGKYLAAIESPLPYFYVPLKQSFFSRRALQIRSMVPPERLAKAVEREIHALDPEMPIIEVRTMRQALQGPNGFLALRFGASMAGAMGLLGLTLAVVGVYGVVAFATARRTREIGIRLALGATSRDAMGLVLWQGARSVIVGVVAGLALTFAATRVMAQFLFFVSASDPLTFAGVTLLLAAIALAACYIPARQAMRVDPALALRAE